MNVDELLKLIDKMPHVPITRSTLCHLDSHVWIYASGSSTDNFPDDLRCDCGMFTWGKSQKILEEIERIGVTDGR